MLKQDELDRLRARFLHFVNGWKIAEANKIALEMFHGSGQTVTWPVVRTFLVRGCYAAAFGDHTKALDLIHQALWNEPDNVFAAHAYQGALAASLADKPEQETPGRVVLGIGTGRCGSTTLAQLFRSQDDAHFTHEMSPRLPWVVKSAKRFQPHVERFRLLRRYYAVVGDTSHFWLPYAEDLIEQLGDVRFVLLKRDKSEVVRSFLKVKGKDGQDEKGAINHWIEHDGTHYNHSHWDDAYPKYDAGDGLESLIGRYYDDYKAECERLAAAYPDRFLTVETADLSKAETQAAIFEFAGLGDYSVDTDLRLNDGKYGDGLEMKF